MASVLTGLTYPYVFNTPRSETYDHMVRVQFSSLGRAWGPLRAVNMPRGRGGQRIDLVHAFNAIPITREPFVLGFEGELPRTMGGFGQHWLRDRLFPRLLDDRCRGLFPISHFAVKLFRRHAEGNRHTGAVLSRMRVVYPSLPVPPARAKTLDPEGPVVITFVGGEWARKGGVVAARLASLLGAAGVRVRMNVVSGLACGEEIYTDTERSFYEPYLAEARAAGVTFLGAMDNAAVLALVADSHFTLLATLDDSFGFSALESMAAGTPVIATGICALPEFITDDNGVVLSLDADGDGRWRFIYTTPAFRRSSGYKAILADTFEDLAEQAAQKILRLIETPADYARMSAAAHRTMVERFDAAERDREWSAIYARALRAG